MTVAEQGFLHMQLGYRLHSGRHHRDIAGTEHGQILEGTARYLCDPQTGGGAHEECSIPQAIADC